MHLTLFELIFLAQLGGATKQSDLKCSLNNEGEYTEDKVFVSIDRNTMKRANLRLLVAISLFFIPQLKSTLD